MNEGLKRAKTRRPSKRIHTRLQQHLTQLADAELVREDPAPEPGYAFKHALTQEAAYGSVLQRRLPVLHRLVAEAYVDLYQDPGDSYAGLIANHFARAGDDANTFEYARRAGDAAFRVYANAEAVTHYTLALEAASRLPRTELDRVAHLYARRGRALELSSRFPEAAANYVEMEQIGQAHADSEMQVAALVAAATIRGIPTELYDPPQANRLLDRALDLARERGDRQAQVTLWRTRALVAGYSGQVVQSLEFGGQAIALARELGLKEQLALALSDSGMPLYNTGQFRRAEAALAEAGELWRELDNRPMLANNLATAAQICRLRGDYAEGIRLAEEAYQIDREVENPWGEVYAGTVLGALVGEQGELDRARSLIQTALNRSPDHPGPSLVIGQGELAWVTGHLGAWDEALEHAEQAEAEVRRGALPGFFTGICFTALARLYIRHGDLDRAAGLLAELGPEGADVTWVSSHRALAQGELELAQAHHARAAELMESLCRDLARTGSGNFFPPARHVLGRALAAMGQTEAALDTLQAASALAAAQNARPTLWPILADLARLEEASGHPAEAAAHLVQARETIFYIADHAGTVELRAVFLGRPDVRAVLAAAGDNQ